jgi:DNA-directed RNA polymerase specialized sigma subunit
MSNFETLWKAPNRPIAHEEEETALIAAARLGDEAATLRLFAAYVPVLRDAAARAPHSLEFEDARQAAILGFLDAVQRANGPRLAGVIRERVTASVTAAASEADPGFAVPERTKRRALTILAEAEGNLDAALALAPKYDMRPDTLLAVWTALNNVRSLEASIVHAQPREGIAAYEPPMEPLWSDREVTDVSDRDLVRKAFNAVNTLESDVCRMAYGFTEPDPIPDAEIGFRLGFGRVRIWRVRHGALDKMRSALGA